MTEKEATFTYNVPWSFLGAKFYPVCEKSVDEIRALHTLTVELNDETSYWLGFAPSCRREFQIVPNGHGLGSIDFPTCRDEPHGHFILAGEDGIAVVPVNIYSQLFFDCALAMLPKIIPSVLTDSHVAVFADLFHTEKMQLLAQIREPEHGRFEFEEAAFLETVRDGLVWIGN
jgi:hypothetical protein